MAFHVGQKCVCIKRGRWAAENGSKVAVYPVRGETYTICRIIDEDAETFLVLHEMPKFDAWLSSNFRPIIQRKTDISIFTAMLTPKKQEIDA